LAGSHYTAETHVSPQALFKRDIGALDRVFEFTGKFASEQGLGEAVVYAMNLAVEELFTNVVKYGLSNGGDVSITVDVADGELVIEIVDDNAEPFDITAAPAVDVDRPLDQRREGGLGIHLIRSIMDYINYEYSDGCARIVVKKRLEGEDV
jgi:anti-sigma regulatory factor (Ser/Thr protein kinase)